MTPFVRCTSGFKKKLAVIYGLQLYKEQRAESVKCFAKFKSLSWRPQNNINEPEKRGQDLNKKANVRSQRQQEN